MMIEQQKMSMVAMEKTRAEAMLSAQEASRAMQEKMDLFVRMIVTAWMDMVLIIVKYSGQRAGMVILTILHC